MKKLIAGILVLIMALSLCACFNDAPIRGEQIIPNATENNIPVDGGEETEGPSLSLGEISGLTYESKFIGIGCQLPAHWCFYTDEQIREINNFTVDAAGEELQQAAENATIIYDMMASDGDGMSNIAVNLEKVDPLQLVLMDVRTNLENTIPIMQSTLENLGYTDVVCTVDTVTIDDREFDCLYTNSVISGFQMYQCTISIKCNGYLASIAVTAFGQEELNELLDGFYLVS